MLKKLLAAVAMMLAAVSFAAVDANKATQAELDSIKGIGPGTAANIMAERKKGDFKDWSDFENRVKGIKDKRAAKLSDAGLTVGGASYSNKSAPAAPKKMEKPAPAAAPVAAIAPAPAAAPAAAASTVKK
ncbi:MAG: hypothetical protein RLZZ401_563 [Pseudomonadota bacterium]|jgi:competence protein ComEA